MMIRNAETKDIPRILELLVQVNHVHAVGRPDLFVDGKRKYEAGDLERILSDKDMPVFVCEKDGRVIGYCMAKLQRPVGKSETKKTILYIDDLCVDENIRKSGVGTALFDYAKEYAKKIGCYSVTLHVWDCNPEARRFYDAMGMKPYMTAMERVL